MYMDANENVITGPLCSKLADIGLIPWGHRLHGHLPNTHVEGSECIDEVWGSIGLEVTGLKVLPFTESIGDHRTFIVDFTTRSAIGLFAHLIVRPDCRRLVNSNKQCAETYPALMEEQFKIHRIQERLDQLTALDLTYPVEEKHAQALERLGIQITQIQTHCKDNCRKITKIDGEYSLPAKYWHEKVVSLRALLRRADKKTHNDGNICRTVRRHGISNPRQLSREQIYELYRIVKSRKHTMKGAQSKFLRKQHLRMLSARAQASGQIERAKEIDGKCIREQVKTMWNSINRVTKTKPPHPGTLLRVEREVDGVVLEFTEEEALVENILEVIQDRFSGAEDAPISNCSITADLGPFGYSELGQQIVDGTFTPPPDLANTATATLLETIAEIGREHRDDDVNITVTGKEFSRVWGNAKERVSSSMSKKHFGHYIAAAASTILSLCFAMQISLIAKWGSPPDRWRNVLMVMLEKKVGTVLIPKLHTILLKEADNNFHDGVMFGGCMLNHVREIGLIPQEQLAEKDCTAEDGVWAKVLKADYARLRRQMLAILSADAANCYDLVNHIILCLILLATGIPIGPIISMLLTISLMRYYLRTGFGESRKYIWVENCHCEECMG
jgi:hypothetical protein